MAEVKPNDGEIKPILLITGASGMLGDALCRLARRHWTVYGAYRRHRPEIAGVRTVAVDLTVRADGVQLVETIQPQAVIHAAANSQVMVCEADPGRTEAINTNAPAWLASHCAGHGIDYLFTSTDLVFDGMSAPYDEQAFVNPVCAYGRQKAAAEKAILERHPKALVCRLPLMFGLAPNAMGHFTVQMIEAIRSGRPIQLLVDEYRSPVDNRSVALGILALLGRRHGIVHLGGRSRVSRYELGLLIAEYMKTRPHMIHPVTIDALDIDVARAPDCTMDSRLAYRNGYNPTPLAEALEWVVDRFGENSTG